MAAVLAANARANSAPPLFVSLTHAMLGVGQGEATLRFIPAVAAVAAIPVVYLLSMALYPHRSAAYLAAALFAVAPRQVLYGQQDREYSLCVLLMGLVMLLAWRTAVAPSPRRIALFAAIEALCLLAQYGLALVLSLLVPAVIVWLWHDGPRRAAVTVLAAQALPAATTLWGGLTTLRYQAWAGGFGANAYLASGYWQGHSLRSLLGLVAGHTYHLVAFALADETIPDSRHESQTYFPPTASFILANEMVPALAACLLILLGIGAALRAERGRAVTFLLLSPFAATLAAGLLRLYPYIAGRQDIYLTVPLMLLTTWGLTALLSFSWSLWRRGVIIAPAAALAALVVVPLLLDTGLYLARPGDEAITGPLGAVRRARARRPPLRCGRGGAGLPLLLVRPGVLSRRAAGRRPARRPHL